MPSCCAPAVKPKWADDLDLRIAAICEHCPSERFRVLPDGRPFCVKLGGCVSPAKLYDVIRRRACPLGHHDAV
jgi:hypothetical protein